MTTHATTIELRPEQLAQLRNARESIGLAQADVAKRASCTREMVAKIEQGRKRPSIGLLQSIAAAIDLTVHVKLVEQKPQSLMEPSPCVPFSSSPSPSPLR